MHFSFQVGVQIIANFKDPLHTYVNALLNVGLTLLLQNYHFKILKIGSDMSLASL